MDNEKREWEWVPMTKRIEFGEHANVSVAAVANLSEMTDAERRSLFEFLDGLHKPKIGRPRVRKNNIPTAVGEKGN